MTPPIAFAVRIVRRQRALVLGAALLLAAFLAGPLAGRGSSTPYVQPRLQCRAIAAADGPLTVVGRGFPGQAGVVVSFDGEVLGEATARRAGGFVVRTTVPSDAEVGAHMVMAVAGAAGSSASCVVTLRP